MSSCTATTVPDRIKTGIIKSVLRKFPAIRKFSKLHNFKQCHLKLLIQLFLWNFLNVLHFMLNSQCSRGPTSSPMNVDSSNQTVYAHYSVTNSMFVYQMFIPQKMVNL